MRIAVWVLTAGVVLGACASNGSNPGTEVLGTEVARTSTTTIPPAPPLESTSTIPVELVPPVQISRNHPTDNQQTNTSAWAWSGQSYDIGTVEKIRSLDGGWLVSFDRASVTAGGVTKSGAQLTSEPILVGSQSTLMRSLHRTPLLFAVAGDAQVLQLNTAWSCGQPTDWLTTTMAKVAANGVGGDHIDTLTFDGNGQVTTVRLSRGC